jgi:hypothetical protein
MVGFMVNGTQMNDRSLFIPMNRTAKFLRDWSQFRFQMITKFACFRKEAELSLQCAQTAALAGDG